MIRQKLLRVFKNQNATNIPVGVGFGISDAASAKAMGNVADAVIVGSAFVKILQRWQRMTLLNRR